MKIRDKVYREVYMDDGTWNKEGDKCLPNSPLKYGRIIGYEPSLKLYEVIWENGKTGKYYLHGITKSA